MSLCIDSRAVLLWMIHQDNSLSHRERGGGGESIEYYASISSAFIWKDNNSHHRTFHCLYSKATNLLVRAETTSNCKQCININLLITVTPKESIGFVSEPWRERA